VVSASFREGLGLNIVEAMLCGKPVLASVNRGHRELVKEGKTGFLIQLEDVQLFPQKINLLRNDISLRMSMGKAGIESAQTYMSDCVITELKELYNKI
jgi:glycosyltransferase EpsD